VIVHAHPAAQPPIGVMALAQASECPRATQFLRWSHKATAQQQPRARRSLTRRVFARSYGFLQRPQIEPLDIIPNRPCRMARSIKTVEVQRAQFDLVAHRLAQPRIAGLNSPRIHLHREMGNSSSPIIAASSNRCDNRITLTIATQRKSSEKDSHALRCEPTGPARLGRPDDRLREPRRMAALW